MCHCIFAQKSSLKIGLRSRRFLCSVGFLKTLGVGVGVAYFCLTPIPEVQLNNFFHRTPKLGIPIEMAQFLWKRLLKQRILVVCIHFH